MCIHKNTYYHGIPQLDYCRISKTKYGFGKMYNDAISKGKLNADAHLNFVYEKSKKGSHGADWKAADWTCDHCESLKVEGSRATTMKAYVCKGHPIASSGNTPTTDRNTSSTSTPSSFSFLTVPVTNLITGVEETTRLLPLSSKIRKRKSVEKIGEENQKKVKVKLENAEKRVQQAEDKLEDALECIVCMREDQKRDTLVMPCRHLNMCGACAAQQNICPTCKVPITNRIKVFLS